MLGDFRQFLSRNIRQHLLCKHDYKYVYRRDLQGGFYEECVKCKKLK
nr:MAG TPA: hypothetical protein [Caudoviricetes sp.]